MVLLHGISTPQDPHAMQEQSAVNLQGFALHVISTLQDHPTDSAELKARSCFSGLVGVFPSRTETLTGTVISEGSGDAHTVWCGHC